MEIMIAVFIGTIIGSFLNVCIYRIPQKQSIVFPSSSCPHCKHALGVFDLFPILSHILLQGKCRYCSAKISIQYPIIELINGLLYGMLFITFGASIEMFFYSLLCSLLLVVFMIDLKTQLIPNTLTLFGLIVGILFRVTQAVLLASNIPLMEGSLGFLAGAVPLFIIIVLSRGGMGAGDLKLMAVVGLFLGSSLTLLTLFYASITGGVVALFLLILKKKGRKSTIPFGPFLVLGTYISIFVGQQVWSWYLSLYR